MTTYGAIEEIAKTEPSRLVYLGSKSSFMWIDTAEKMLKKLPFLDDLYHKECESNLRKAKCEYSACENDLADCEDPEAKEILEARRTVLAARLNRAQRNLDNWAFLPERNVLDKRYRITDSGITIIVSGSEHGHYFLKDEISEDIYKASECGVEPPKSFNKNGCGTRVFCDETSKVYESMHSCARCLGVSAGSVKYAVDHNIICQGKYHIHVVEDDE